MRTSLLLLAALILASCGGSGTFVAGPRSRVVVSPYDGLARTISGTAAAAPLDAGSFVTLHPDGSSFLRVERLDDELRTLWSTPIAIGDASASVEISFMDMKHYGLYDVQEEPPLLLYAHDGLVGLVTFRYVGDDSMQTRGVTLDAATGTVRTQTALATTFRDTRHHVMDQRVLVAVSPDSSAFAIYSIRRYDSSTGIASIRVFSSDLSPIGSLEEPVEIDRYGAITSLLCLDDAGRITIARMDEKRVMTVARHDLRAATNRLVTMTLDSLITAGSVPALEDLRADAAGRVIVTTLSSAPERSSVGVWALDFDRDVPTAVLAHSIRSDTNFINARVIPSHHGDLVVVLDDGSAGTWRVRSSGVTSTYRHPGAVVFVALDGTGRERWRSEISRSHMAGTFAYRPFSSSAFHLTSRGSLQVLTFDQTKQEVVLRELRLSDGTDVTYGGLILTTAVDAYEYLSTATRWLDDDTVLQMLSSGAMIAGRTLALVRYSIPASN